MLGAICDQLAELHRAGALADRRHQRRDRPGDGRDGLPLRPRAIDELQAASAVGQGKLYQVYDELLRARGMPTAQVLLTFFDMSARTHYLNARQTLRKLLDWRVVPVINENDTTTTDEISFGNNDFLAAQVAILLGAELLVLLTDAEGVFTADPRVDPARAADRGGRPTSTSSTELDIGHADLAAGLGRHALQGGGGRDGHRRRHPDRDRQRPGARGRSSPRPRRAGRHRGSPPARAATRASSCGSSTPSRSAAACSSTPGRRARCARAGPACCRSASSRSPARSTPATRSRSPTTDEAVGKGICNYSAAELRQVRGTEVGRRARGAAARERGGDPPGLLRARVTLYRRTTGSRSARPRPSPRPAPPPSGRRATLATLELRRQGRRAGGDRGRAARAHRRRSSRPTRATSSRPRGAACPTRCSTAWR